MHRREREIHGGPPLSEVFVRFYRLFIALTQLTVIGELGVAVIHDGMRVPTFTSPVVPRGGLVQLAGVSCRFCSWVIPKA